MSYKAPVPDLTLILDHVVGFDRVWATDRFTDATPDVVTAMLREAGKLCEAELAPLDSVGDTNPAYLENGAVRTSPGFAEGYRALAGAGLIGKSGPEEFGGMGLPHAITTAVNEMVGSACLAPQLNPLMTQGQSEALAHHASDDMKARNLPHLISGEWCGTLNLAEPQAGSDVGALTSGAVPKGDVSDAVTAQKIYISWDDNDSTENVCHLVVARLPDGQPGTNGISLLIMPKKLPDADGKSGVMNTLKGVSLERKIGLHGSPTCVMHYIGATDWLVGEPHEGMLNNARLGIGVQDVSIAEAAYRQAVAYTQNRKQWRSSVESDPGTILDHADVRRMLTAMKAEIFAARALALDLAIGNILVTTAANTKARAACLMPICKSHGTDTGIAVANEGIQVRDGIGFIEKSSAAQFLRDGRVTAIYEGTNGFQAMDLVGRKMTGDGAVAFALLDEVAETAAEKGGIEGASLAADALTLRAATERLIADDLVA